MKFLPIFAGEQSGLWSVCFSEDGGVDAFKKFMRLVRDHQSLLGFFKLNRQLLQNPFWSNLSTEDAIDQVVDEGHDLERELKCFELPGPECEGILPREIFEPFDKGMYILRSRNSVLKKVRTNPDFFDKPMLRIYAVRLDDNTMVITGGVIKLTLKLEGDNSKEELRRLNMVKDYISAYKIVSKEGLL